MFLTHLEEFGAGIRSSRNYHQVTWLERYFLTLTCYRFLVMKWDAYLLSIHFTKNINGVRFRKGSNTSGRRKQLKSRHIPIESKGPLMSDFTHKIDFSAANSPNDNSDLWFVHKTLQLVDQDILQFFSFHAYRFHVIH